jgi:hypothetical protein
MMARNYPIAKACGWLAGVLLTGCGETTSNPNGSADAECQGALELCDGLVCQQQCAASDECAAAPSGDIPPFCWFTGDAPGDCVLPCGNGGPECPMGMRCHDYGYCVW